VNRDARHADRLAFDLHRLVKAWGDGTSVAADGTQVDTMIDNLLAESHIRHGGYGGYAYHHIARCSQISSRAACGRRSTSSKAPAPAA
jgi:hypothetical protein